ncbi:hypothetical protein [Sphingobacterium pedocola]|uniref:Response regulatory domain-containing protein n=1 Tax=Sphingobacterium pedocola TaxID=2082722 RepID=A0ABR9TBQ6_9SPHI|nr:hypothetical protein [Sphingobacterium pedocola]MBE8722472.1 hypothetical protein [Sphingobacterium pedocola]
MENVKVGILSNNRRLRFAYKMLLSQATEQHVDVLFDKISLQDVDTPVSLSKQPDVIIVDERVVYKNKALFFSFLRQLYPNCKVLLLIDEASQDLARKVKRFVQGVTEKTCSAQKLISTVQQLADNTGRKVER